MLLVVSFIFDHLFFRFLSSGLRNQIVFLYFLGADGICLTELQSLTHTSFMFDGE